MPRQIHAVVQQPQYFQHVIIGSAKNHEVTGFVTVASSVQGANAWGQFISRFCAECFGAVGQGLDSQ
jgi:hypothetical protein